MQGTFDGSINLSARWTWPGLRPGGEAALIPPQIHPLYIIVLVWYYVTPDGGTTASVARRAPILYGANDQYIEQYMIQYIDPPPPPFQIQFIGERFRIWTSGYDMMFIRINTRIDATGSFTDDHICTFSTRWSSRDICPYMQTVYMSRDPPTDPSVHSYSNKVYETVSSMVSMESSTQMIVYEPSYDMYVHHHWFFLMKTKAEASL